MQTPMTRLATPNDAKRQDHLFLVAPMEFFAFSQARENLSDKKSDMYGSSGDSQ